MAGAEPPPLYAYDPDVGRLAVTTPTYNTAIVAVNRGAFPYGGVELARLFDGEQDVAGGVGGRPPASFGVVVRDRAGRIAAASQRAVDEHDEPLRAPRGAARATSHPAPPFAGPFQRLRVQGSIARAAGSRSAPPTASRRTSSRPSGASRRERQDRRGPLPELGLRPASAP